MEDKASTNGISGSGVLNKLASDYGNKSTDESEDSDDTCESDTSSDSSSESSSESDESPNNGDYRRHNLNSEQGYVSDDVEFSTVEVEDSKLLPEATEKSSVISTTNEDSTTAMEESSQMANKSEDSVAFIQNTCPELADPLNSIERSSAVEGLLEVKDQVYRERRSSCSSSSESSTSSSDDSIAHFSADSSDSESEQKDTEDKNKTTDRPKKTREPKKAPRVKGELTLDDLDPIVDLQISVPEDKVQPIGEIKNIVGCIVTVESFENKPALDLSTVLFVDEGRKALGHVFEVFGRTSQPYYCVRFNSLQHIEERGIAPGMTVYAAPGTEHTRYVFLAQITKFKGTDASWKDDVETPGELLEFSDDEQEKFAKNRRNKARPKKTQPINRSVPPPPLNQGPQIANRFARKRNFNYADSSEVSNTDKNINGHIPDRYAPPTAAGNGFAPSHHSPHYRSMGPVRSPVFRPPVGGFRPPSCDGGYPSPDFFGAPRFRSVGPYGPPPPYGPPTPPYGPPPTQFNPYFCGNNMPYRQPYETDPYNQGWWNYTNQRPGMPWYPPSQTYYDHQASWGRFQGQNDIPTFSAPFTPSFTAPPPPPPNVPTSVPTLCTVATVPDIQK